MKVLYFYRGVPVSTPLMHINFIIAALRRQGHEVVECFPAVGERRTGTADISALARWKAWFRAHMPRPMVNLAQLYEARRARPRLLDICLRERPDFIYERYSIFTDAGLRAAKAAGCPLIQEVNSIYSLQHAHVFAPGFRALARNSDKRLLPQADALIAVSGVVARSLENLGVPAGKITVMHNAVDASEYTGLAEKREELRASLGLENAFVVVVLQALDAGPFPAELLRSLQEAWPRVRQSVPQARVLWIGGGSRFEWFRNRVLATVAGADTEIIMLGRRPHAEVPGLLVCGDVGLVPWHRPFCSPMKLFEYMAARLPVIAPNIDGLSEVIRDGENGLLFPDRDCERMADLIVQLSADPESAAALADRGYQCVLRDHTWDGNAARVVRIAEQFLRASQRPG